MFEGGWGRYPVFACYSTSSSFLSFPLFYCLFVFIKVVVMPVLPLKPFLAYKQNEFRIGGNLAKEEQLRKG